MENVRCLIHRGQYCPYTEDDYVYRTVPSVHVKCLTGRTERELNAQDWSWLGVGFGSSHDDSIDDEIQEDRSLSISPSNSGKVQTGLTFAEMLKRK